MTTSQLSMELDLEDESPSSVGGFPVSRLASQVNVKALVTAVISGQTCSESLLRFSQNGWLPKTSQDSLALTEDEPLEPSSVTWPRWAIVSGGECYPLTPLEHVTSDSESLSLGTPRSSQAMARPLSAAPSGPKGRLDEQQIAVLPTPTVSPGRNETSGRKPGSKHHSGTTLYDFAYKVLGTPNARDHKGKGRDGQLRTQLLATPAAADAQGSHGGGQGRSLRTDTAHYRQETGERGTLNPCFVAEMMGFPITWFKTE